MYVGTTNDSGLRKRVDAHRRGAGSAWTRKYPVVRLLSSSLCNNRFEEDNKVLELMQEHGIDRVRGGTYSNVYLSRQKREEIEEKLRHNNDACFRCGRKGHFANTCYSWVPEYESESEAEDSCYRCGRQGHWASECYAKRDVSGRII